MDAMDAKRLQLLGAFAAGCLATLAFVGSRFSDGEDRPNAVVARVVTAPPALAANLEDEADGSALVAAPAKAASSATLEDDAKTESGRSVAEVLGRLEAAYREELGRAQGGREEVAVAPAEPERSASETAAAVAPPVMAPAAIAPAASVAPVLTAPAAVVDHAAVNAAPAPVLVAQTEAPARSVTTGDIHVGDTHRNLNAGSVHQGDAYVLQQQLALIQYIQFVALSQHGAVAAPPQNARKPLPRRVPVFSTHLTNPDNPWGFDFPPTVLVK